MARKFDEGKNYYATLGVSGTADQKAIRTAYHQLALSVHPDKTGNHETTKDTSELNEAYRVLSNEPVRKQYDGRRARHTKQRLYGTSVKSLIDQMLVSTPSLAEAFKLTFAVSRGFLLLVVLRDRALMRSRQSQSLKR